MSKHFHGNQHASGAKADFGGEQRAAQAGAGDNRPDQGGSPAGDQAADAGKEESPASGAEAENAAGNPETSGGDAAGPADWQLKAAELEAKLAELNGQYLRKAADFENFRKRVNREKQELTDFANLNLLLDLLPVIDDFERAIKSAETSKDFASFYEGIAMIEKRLSTQLENKWGLKRFDSEGEPFDPNRHEALQMEKAAGVDGPVVKEDYVKGYFLKEKVIRYAKVKVLMPLEQQAPGGGAETGNGGQGTGGN